jgi:hypothetical protein
LGFDRWSARASIRYDPGLAAQILDRQRGNNKQESGAQPKPKISEDTFDVHEDSPFDLITGIWDVVIFQHDSAVPLAKYALS